MQENKEKINKPDNQAQQSSGEGISGLFIRRPVTTVMISVALVVLGLIGYKSMGVDMYPNVDFPYVTVQTILTGSSPEEIETSITKQVEESVNVISGLEESSSFTMEGSSFVILKFALERTATLPRRKCVIMLIK